MKIRLGRWLAAAAATTYLVVWGWSLIVALGDHSHEPLPADGHGMLEGAYMVLVGITQPLGLLGGTALASLGVSGPGGTVLLWCISGVLGAVQWIGVIAVLRAVWLQFRHRRMTLHIK